MQKKVSHTVGAIALLFCLSASALEISGVTVEPTITVAGTTLVLNGAGVRFKGPAKVNVAEIHATKPFSSLEELVALPGPKRITMTMLREVPSDMMGKSLTRGIEDNSPKKDLGPLIPSLIRIGDVFNTYKVLSAGDRVTIDWIPGQGTVFTVKDKVQGEPFKDAEFFRALASIWLGPIPVDFKLKPILLGKK